MSAEPTRVLIIEDELQMRRMLRFLLEGEGYVVTETGTGATGLARARELAPEVILVDLGLPDIDGTELVAKLAERGRNTVIVVSARDQEQQKVRALDLGADDYVTKPFSPAELLARIRAGLRHRTAPEAEDRDFAFRDLRVDFRSEQVYLRNTAVHLSSKEYKLLRALIRRRGTISTHKELLAQVWGAGVHDVHYLRVYVKRLRSKLESDPVRPVYILTEPNVGYRFGI